jgi:hypothetical protein
MRQRKWSPKQSKYILVAAAVYPVSGTNIDIDWLARLPGYSDYTLSSFNLFYTNLVFPIQDLNRALIVLFLIFFLSFSLLQNNKDLKKRLLSFEFILVLLTFFLLVDLLTLNNHAVTILFFIEFLALLIYLLVFSSNIRNKHLIGAALFSYYLLNSIVFFNGNFGSVFLLLAKRHVMLNLH